MGFLSNLFKNNKYKTINGNELIDLLKNNRNCIIIDVRTAQEFKSGHIEKAKNISVSELRSKVNSIIKYKHNDVVLYCASGARSKSAANFLYKEGFENIYNLKGGMSSYLNAKIK